MRDLASRLRGVASRAIGTGFFGGLSYLFLLHPRAWPRANAVERIRDVPYREGGCHSHRLDVYRPTSVPPPWPVVLYVHGGGFNTLSKNTHWLMGLAFARSGYLVFNIDYRLAPAHPFPAALDDCAHALSWVGRHAGAFGGDLQRLVLAGESAGANLVTSLAICGSYRRTEPAAQRVWCSGIRPRGVVAACGIFQVSEPERFIGVAPRWFAAAVRAQSEEYLGRSTGAALADPVVALETGQSPDRPLPAFFTPVGGLDPLAGDTERLNDALGALGAQCEARVYPGEHHAFHAFVWRRQAIQCWGDILDFADRHCRRADASAASAAALAGSST